MTTNEDEVQEIRFNGLTFRVEGIRLGERYAHPTWDRFVAVKGVTRAVGVIVGRNVRHNSWLFEIRGVRDIQYFEYTEEYLVNTLIPYNKKMIK